MLEEELLKFEKSQTRLVQVKNEVQADMLEKLHELEQSGKEPSIVYDTYVLLVRDKYLLKDAEAVNVVKDAIRDKWEIMGTDLTTIYFKKMIRCECGARYSSKLSTCPGCKKKGV